MGSECRQDSFCVDGNAELAGAWRGPCGLARHWMERVAACWAAAVGQRGSRARGQAQGVPEDKVVLS